jgi:AraC-like DNA-binding protein
MPKTAKVEYELKPKSNFLETIHQALGGEFLDAKNLFFDTQHPLLSGTIKQHTIREGLRIVVARDMYIKKPISLERVTDTSNNFVVGNVYVSNQPLISSTTISDTDAALRLNEGVAFSSSEISYIDILPIEQPFSYISFVFNLQWIQAHLQPQEDEYLSKLFTSNHTFSLIETLPTTILQLVKDISRIDINDSFDKLLLDNKVLEFTIWALKTLEKRESPKAFMTMNKYDLQSILSVHQILIDNLSTPLPLSILAKKAGMSESKIKIAFKQVYGTSIYQYIINCRMEKAYLMIEKEKRMIGDVSDELGYVNQSQFTKRFKEHFNMLPTEVLKKNS